MHGALGGFLGSFGVYCPILFFHFSGEVTWSKVGEFVTIGVGWVGVVDFRGTKFDFVPGGDPSEDESSGFHRAVDDDSGEESGFGEAEDFGEVVVVEEDGHDFGDKGSEEEGNLGAGAVDEAVGDVLITGGPFLRLGFVLEAPLPEFFEAFGDVLDLHGLAHGGEEVVDGVFFLEGKVAPAVAFYP